MPSEDLHILLRYSQSLEGLDDTISEHQAVLSDLGEVYFGKIGRAFGQRTLALIGTQISAGHPTFLFLAARTGRRDFVLHKATLRDMSLELPSGDGALVPYYYTRAGITGRVGTWFRISSLDRINQATLKALNVASTGTPILDVLGPSRNPMFIVTAKTGSKV